MAVRSLSMTVGKLSGEVEGLRRWQDRQNGSLQKIEQSVAGLEVRLRRLELLIALAVGLGILNVVRGFVGGL